MNLLIAVKRSKWERDVARYGSDHEVRRLYEIQNRAYDRIHDSYLRQDAALSRFREALPAARFVERPQLPDLDYAEFDCVISLGGDNHFVYVSGFLPAGLPIAGVNSDPRTSKGSLLAFDSESFLEAIRAANEPRLVLECWTRIDCSIRTADGRITKTPPCTSEISVRNAFPDLISRYLLRVEDAEWEEQKSSGLILATGAGSTGWYRNCHNMADQDQVTFPNEAPFFRTIARELRATHRYRFRTTQIDRGRELQVVSEMDGQISIDTHPEFTYDFPPGAVATFTVSSRALPVVRAFE